MDGALHGVWILLDLVFDPLTSQIHVHATDQPEETRLRQESWDQLGPYLDSEICGVCAIALRAPDVGTWHSRGEAPFRGHSSTWASGKKCLYVGLENNATPDSQLLVCPVV